MLVLSVVAACHVSPSVAAAADSDSALSAADPTLSPAALRNPKPSQKRSAVLAWNRSGKVMPPLASVSTQACSAPGCGVRQRLHAVDVGEEADALGPGQRLRRVDRRVLRDEGGRLERPDRELGVVVLLRGEAGEVADVVGAAQEQDAVDAGTLEPGCCRARGARTRSPTCSGRCSARPGVMPELLERRRDHGRCRRPRTRPPSRPARRPWRPRPGSRCRRARRSSRRWPSRGRASWASSSTARAWSTSTPAARPARCRSSRSWPSCSRTAPPWCAGRGGARRRPRRPA